MKTPTKRTLGAQFAAIALAFAAIICLCTSSLIGIHNNAWADDETFAQWSNITEEDSEGGGVNSIGPKTISN